MNYTPCEHGNYPTNCKEKSCLDVQEAFRQGLHEGRATGARCSVFPCDKCDSPVVTQEVPEWEVQIGQLASKAWKEGLWHSQSKLIESLKEFCISFHNQTLEQIVEVLQKEKIKVDESSSQTINYDQGINKGLSSAQSLIRSLKT